MQLNPKSSTSDLIIRACLSEDKPTIEKLSAAWAAATDPNDMEPWSMRLVPYFVDHLKKYGVALPHAARLKVVYKYWWLKSKWISHELEEVTDMLSRAGIPLMVFKGAALFRFYEQSQHRTMGDLDLMVPEHQIKEAYLLLTGAGFTGDEATFELYKSLPTFTRANRHAFHLTHKGSGLQIDLHWSLNNKFHSGLTKLMWQEAKPDPVNEKRLLPPLYLLYIINGVNGFLSGTNHGNWVLDALMMKRAFVANDHQRLEQCMTDFSIPAFEASEAWLSYFQGKPIEDLIELKTVDNWKLRTGLWAKAKGYFHVHQQIFSHIRLYNGTFTWADYLWRVTRIYGTKLIAKWQQPRTVLPEPQLQVNISI